MDILLLHFALDIKFSPSSPTASLLAIPFGPTAPEHEIKCSISKTAQFFSEALVHRRLVPRSTVIRRQRRLIWSREKTSEIRIGGFFFSFREHYFASNIVGFRLAFAFRLSFGECEGCLRIGLSFEFEKMVAFLPLEFEGPDSEAEGDDGYGLKSAADGLSSAAAVVYSGVLSSVGSTGDGGSASSGGGAGGGGPEESAFKSSSSDGQLGRIFSSTG